jgi:hypothetical protein
MDIIGNHDLDTRKIKVFQGKQFCWNWLSSIGSVGSILMGFYEDGFDIERWVIRKFSLSCDVIYKKHKNMFRVTIVYGAADEDNKQEFLN